MSLIKYLVVFTFVHILKPYWMVVLIIGVIIFIGLMILKYMEGKEEPMKSGAKMGAGQDDAKSIANQDNVRLMEENAKEAKAQDAAEPDTRGLMFSTLCNLGCQPVNNDDGSLFVQYQGENFHMEFYGRYAQVWDPGWACIRADDPEMPRIREAVNIANFKFGPAVVLTAPDEEGVINFHSRRDIMLHPACPDNVPFVKAVLDSFFDAKENVRGYFRQLAAQQQEAVRSRRPVGFATDDQTIQENYTSDCVVGYVFDLENQSRRHG